LRQYANVAESLDVHCCRICQRWCTLPPSMHAAIRASSVYVKFWTVHLPDLSSALATNFIYIYIYYFETNQKNKSYLMKKKNFKRKLFFFSILKGSLDFEL
jgi:hypothetical protein